MKFDFYRTIKEFLKKYPISSTIIIINFIMFLVLVINGGSKNTNTLVEFGAFSNEGIKNLEIYRFFTSGFLHSGIIHLTLNTVFLIKVVPLLEKALKQYSFLLVYFLSMFGGNLFVYFSSSEEIVTVGASGAIFGVLGGLSYIVIKKPYLLNNKYGKNILLWIGINFFVGFFFPQVSVVAHLGGIIVGTIVTFVVTKNFFVSSIDRQIKKNGKHTREYIKSDIKAPF